EWYIRILRDPLTAVRGTIMDITNISSRVQLPTSPTWDPCPEETANATRRRRLDSFMKPARSLPFLPAPHGPAAGNASSVAARPPPPLQETTYAWSVRRGESPTREGATYTKSTNQTDHRACRRMCEAREQCNAFSFQSGQSECSFTDCFDAETATWDVAASDSEFHYFERRSCARRPAEAGAIEGRRLLQTGYRLREEPSVVRRSCALRMDLSIIVIGKVVGEMLRC
ncbi:hypothetical protein CYMTET_52278, partial [Cymbomonas tetramitiformis]